MKIPLWRIALLCLVCVLTTEGMNQLLTGRFDRDTRPPAAASSLAPSALTHPSINSPWLRV